MSKHIKFKYDNKEYTLEYNRKSVADIEAMGFVASEISTKMATMLPLAFKGAFLMHHANLKNSVVEEMFEAIPDRDKLLGSLSSMIAECYQSLLSDENENENSKNVSWEIVE